ncbi:hypothetical protein [Hymenobacter metallicola]|uniref:Uncharacterized protein n=1 Tax=Hymenobacter metallicola TaxID=2563114 RepID=A0A4Z0PVU3_9BACT|nr:hypothetical protein [Hymenobacter metallicola]TGE20973.1 hypothetical protein E5K02_24730 [Hymenobacter metallicola]
MPTRFCLRILLHLILIVMCTNCGPTSSEEQRQAAEQLHDDTVEVTSFDIKYENSPALAKWEVWEAGREIICTPPGWKSHLEDDGATLVLLLADNTDSPERITFTRLEKDTSSLDYPALAQQLINAPFPGFQLAEGDTVKKLMFQHDFAVERDVNLRATGRAFHAYGLVYVNDRNLYHFRIILDKRRLKAYQGDLIDDIVGNLQIDRKYLMRNDNPLQQVIYLTAHLN